MTNSADPVQLASSQGISCSAREGLSAIRFRSFLSKVCINETFLFMVLFKIYETNMFVKPPSV